MVINGSQQQFLVRDTKIGGRSNGVWNQVSSGTVGANAQSFLVPPHDGGCDAGVEGEALSVFRRRGALDVPRPVLANVLSRQHLGDRLTPGRSLPLSDFYVACPGDVAALPAARGAVNSPVLQQRPVS